MKKPNILVIMTEQQRYDSLGCYGADWVKTPNLDRLAAEGIQFQNCYVNNPVCTPSRASMFTGKQLPGLMMYTIYTIYYLMTRFFLPGTCRTWRTRRPCLENFM